MDVEVGNVSKYYCQTIVGDTHLVYCVLDGAVLTLERIPVELNLSKINQTHNRFEEFIELPPALFEERINAQASKDSVEVFTKKFNLLYSKKIFRLCYVDGPWAYFTTQEDPSKQWGDDWDDAPYEHNAGSPYEPNKNVKGDYLEDIPLWEIKKVAFDGNLQTPADYSGLNSPYSVQQINKGAVAWLSDRWGSSGVVIQAGTSLEMFEELVKKSGGKVYK